MDLALYCPVCGFYEKENDTLGRRGDYYTSVTVGSLFGELLAAQFAAWLTPLATPATGAFLLVEAGAHDGTLAKDILAWFHHRQPALAARIQYCIVEPSPRRQAWQRETLRHFRSCVHWADGLSAIGDKVRGIIFSNELLDAMPVHRLGWEANRRAWFEWGVTIEGDHFAWERLPDSAHAAGFNPPVPPGLLDVLPDGFTTEICPAGETWWREAAGVLDAGRLLTLDYGLAAEDFFTPERKDGTLRAYRRHRQSSDVLADPGGQDITAHVNFTRIQSVGESAGLKTESFQSQPAFLTAIARNAWDDPSQSDAWTAHHTRQFQTLTHPNHLGRAFRVLVQSR